VCVSLSFALSACMQESMYVCMYIHISLFLCLYLSICFVCLSLSALRNLDRWMDRYYMQCMLACLHTYIQ
jgi:hypothetical protein